MKVRLFSSSRSGRRLKKQKRMESHSLLWVWEFSKKVVLICVTLYVIEQLYAMLVMWRSGDYSYLGTMMSESSEVLRAGVFGYFIKAGAENAIKIFMEKRLQKSASPSDETQTDSPGDCAG